MVFPFSCFGFGFLFVVLFFPSCRNVRTWENGKTPAIFLFLLFCLPIKRKLSFMSNPNPFLTFQKRFSFRTSYHTRLNSLNCSVSATHSPYLLHLEWNSKEKKKKKQKKTRAFSPLLQHTVQSIYKKIGAVVFSPRTPQKYPYKHVHKTSEVTTSSS